jgi:hypothetical protein
LKNKVQVFESRSNAFATIWLFFQELQYWCDECYKIFILVNWVFFIITTIPDHLKNDVIVGDIFGVLFQVHMIWHKLFWEVKRRLKMPTKKIKSFICFEMLEEGYCKTIFFYKYVQNILLTPPIIICSLCILYIGLCKPQLWWSNP